MRKFTLLILWILVGLFIIGCDSHEDIPIDETTNSNHSDGQWDMHPAIMVDGELFFSTGKLLPISVDESVIKTVSSVTSSHKLPSKEGEINFSFSDAKYAKINEATAYVVVMVDLDWEKFVLETELLP